MSALKIPELIEALRKEHAADGKPWHSYAGSVVLKFMTRQDISPYDACAQHYAALQEALKPDLSIDLNSSNKMVYLLMRPEYVVERITSELLIVIMEARLEGCSLVRYNKEHYAHIAKRVPWAIADGVVKKLQEQGFKKAHALGSDIQVADI